MGSVKNYIKLKRFLKMYFRAVKLNFYGNQVLCAEISCKPGLVLLVMLIVITDSATYRIHLEQQVLSIFSAVLKANRRGQCFSTSHSDTNNQQKQGSRAEGTPAKSVNTQTHM